MTRNPFFDAWFKPNLSNPILVFGSAPIDMKAMMESGRRTFQAFTEAQQIVMESLQTIAQRQGEIMSQFVQDQSVIARDIANEGTPEEKIARSADLARQAYEKSIRSNREVADMLSKSTREAGDIINSRITDALDELKTTVEDAPLKTRSSKAA